jgi:hypothetical protein
MGENKVVGEEALVVGARESVIMDMDRVRCVAVKVTRRRLEWERVRLFLEGVPEREVLELLEWWMVVARWILSSLASVMESLTRLRWWIRREDSSNIA